MQQQLRQQALTHFVYPDVAPPSPLAPVLVMLHECWLMYRWISGMAGGEQGPCPVCWKDEEICHYPLWTIPLTLSGTRLLIALRILPNRDSEKKHHRQTSWIDQLSWGLQRFFFIVIQILKHDFPLGAVIFSMYLTLVAAYKTAYMSWSQCIVLSKLRS